MAYARGASPLALRGRGVFDWLTGTGFLVLDAAAFFISLAVLIPWNLYRSPADFWVADPLRSWAFLLTFHALVVGAIALARGIVSSPEANEDAQPERTAIAARSSTTASRVPDAAAITASSLLAEDWARRWISEPGEVTAASVASSQTIEGANESTGEVLVQRTEVIWPDPPAESHPVDDAETLLAEWLEHESADPQVSRQTPVDPLRVAAGFQSTPGEEPIDPDLEWTWVEAAASAWLSKRQPGASSNNGHSPHDPGDQISH